MPESPADRVVFGLGGAWGFAQADLTSPALAASGGAFTDSTLLPDAPDFTELRVHGVSGSSGPVMLEHPAALQVAGDGTTMFYRRWTPAGTGGVSVPWKLEAYSWGGLTESPLASASWLLFAPFMLYNVAHFALPPQKAYQKEPVREPAARGAASRDTAAELLGRDAWHASAAMLLRLLAFSATLQFTEVIVSILVSSAGLQAPNAHLPSWLLWYRHWMAGGRVALTMAGVAAVIALMWLISIRTAHRYEARISRARPRVNEKWPLTQTRFWKGQELVERHRSLHAGGALAITALIVSRPAAHMGGGRLALLTISALVLTMIAVTLCLPMADRHNVTLADRQVGTGRAPRGQVRETLWCHLMLVGGAGVFTGAFFTSGWPAEDQASHLTLPGFTNACAFLLAVQGLLLVLLGMVVWKLARSAPKPDNIENRPFGAGHLSTVLAVLAVGLGGAFSAVTGLFATRVFGTPVPSGVRFSPPPANALQIPWPIYALAFAPIGLLIGVVISAAWIGYKWNQLAGQFAADDKGKSEIAEFYGTKFGNADSEGYLGCRTRIARAWATGRLVDHAAVVAFCAAAGVAAATLWAEIWAALASPHTVVDQKLHGFAAIESLIGLAVGGVLVGLLRSDYGNPSRRKTIGAIWDVGTFWPRATHPFAPPCYAERAIPELVDRIRILTGTVREDDTDPAWQQIKAHERNADAAPRLSIPPGPVLLTGYSQGAVIAPAVVAQLPDEACNRTALLTLACPARRLYGRAFPAYFGEERLMTLAQLLDSDHRNPPVPRWKNLVRRTDYIGSWVFRNPAGGDASPALAEPGVDQPCWDPVTITADTDPTPPPIHYHSGFWQDPRVTQLGKHLMGQWP